MDLKQQAFEMYRNGETIKSISEQLDVKESTLYTWKSRFFDDMEAEANYNELYNEILSKLAERGLAKDKVYLNMANNFMELENVKNMLIADIKTRGVTVEGATALKKNDSISELNKTVTSMVSLIKFMKIDIEIESEIADL
ncbi:helix-turn-helix domain-containing protein [Bacillus cereus group sp. N6]|uniref:helix-turn-helix domain-containing protein n=1 Tax=Bacillus cereus group sp. N6 TaxID=2794583 RepID=UPI0018F3242E|nr:helix-turn-helix domain-containing protein [Bacillus cereus group sp. N6]MBJ8113487.1 helix-turn-helix domain-containing protein [Bacillus cereus group sp. N6]